MESMPPGLFFFVAHLWGALREFPSDTSRIHQQKMTRDKTTPETQRFFLQKPPET